MADHCFEALTNKNQWEKFAGEHKSIAEKIIDFIREFVAMISNAFDKYFVHDNSYIRDSVIGEVEYMNKIADMLWEGVDEAVENYRSGTVNKSGETKYSQSDIDNNKKNSYNKNKEGVSYEPTAEFRRIQAESQRISEDDAKMFHSGDRTLDDGIRRR